MNRTCKIFLACFLGGTIGSLVANQFGWFWWIGILIGGGVGYLAYEFGTVVQSFKKYWDRESKVFRSDMKSLWELTPPLLYLLTSVSSWLIVVLCLLQQLSIPSIQGDLPFLLLLAFLLSCFLYMIALAAVCGKDGRDPFRSRKDFMAANTRSIAPVMLFWYIPQILFRVVMCIPIVCGLLWRVCKQTFIAIHSEIRLLCMTDAMIGACIGCFCHNALIGGIAGAAFGVINYRIVSIRWLKLAKA